MRARSTFFTIILCALFAISSKANAQYITTGETLIAGTPVTISVPQADTLFLTYRPGSNIAEIETVLTKEATYEWTPREAGIIALSTPNGPTQTVSVRFRSLSYQGLIVFILAGGILFGGALFASFKLFGKKSSKTLTDRPDT